jgi:hypothetical protein
MFHRQLFAVRAFPHPGTEGQTARLGIVINCTGAQPCCPSEAPTPPSYRLTGAGLPTGYPVRINTSSDVHHH